MKELTDKERQIIGGNLMSKLKVGMTQKDVDKLIEESNKKVANNSYNFNTNK